MHTPLRVISSMATKPLLADLVLLFKAHAPEWEVQVESVGGVDAAKRVQAGEAFDCVVLASNAIDTLIAGSSASASLAAMKVRPQTRLMTRTSAMSASFTRGCLVFYMVLGLAI